MLSKQQDSQRLYLKAIGDIATKLRRDDNLTVRVGMDTNLCNDRHDFYVNYIFHWRVVSSPQSQYFQDFSTLVSERLGERIKPYRYRLS